MCVLLLVVIMLSPGIVAGLYMRRAAIIRRLP